MKIKVDNDLILSYAIIGNVDNSIDIDDEIVPIDFFESFKPKKYKYINEEIILNEDFTEDEEQPTQPPIIEMPSSDEELRKMFADMQVQIVQANTMCTQVSQQNANLSQEVVKLNKEIENLKGANDNENVIS